MNNNFLLAQTVQVPTMVGGEFEYKEYDAEVGHISKMHLGFEPNHGSFTLAVEIMELFSENIRSTGYRYLSTDRTHSMALVAEVIKTLGGDHADISGLVGKPAILMRDRDASAVPVGIASPVTGKYCLFATDYSIEEEKS